MKSKFSVKLAVLLSSALLSATAFGAERLAANQACTAKESWNIAVTELPADAQLEFKNFISGKSSPARAIGEALALRRAAASNEMRAFSEYWIARALYEGKLVHAAYAGFTEIALNPPTRGVFGVQSAALQCLNQVFEKYPSLGLPAGVSAKLADFMALAGTRGEYEPLWQYAENYFRTQIAENQNKLEVSKTMALLDGSGPRESLVKGLWAAEQNDLAGTTHFLQKFIANSSGYSRLRVNEARALLGRVYYGLGQFNEAAAQYRLVSKDSNELVEAISELAWSTLQAERYTEAIGAALSLQAGGLRRTFAPEAPMVAAMALNEICQFPESLKAIGTFKHNYEKSYRWLSSWQESPVPARPDLAREAIAFIKHQAHAPDRVASEWVRSPVFLASQTELNLLVDERDSLQAMNRSGAREQRLLATDIQKSSHELKSRIHAEKAKQKTYSPGIEGLSAPLKAELAGFRGKVSHYRRLQNAAPVWRAIAARQEQKAGPIRTELLARINSDLSARNVRMLTQLQEIAENNQMIEVEIYNGASQDIIWQNSHPDYKHMAKKMIEEQQRASAAKTLNWGRIPTSDENSEIWEDELGSFKANLYDNCSNKERYLAIKQIQNQMSAQRGG